MSAPDRTNRPYEPSAGVVAATVGVALLGVGAALVGNGTEHVLFAILGVVAGACGLYLLLAGAVARGIQLAAMQSAASRADRRRDDRPA